MDSPSSPDVKRNHFKKVIRETKQMQESKKELIEDIINSNLETSTSLKKLSREDIIDLFENME